MRAQSFLESIRRFVPPLVTVAVFWMIFRRVPVDRFLNALASADAARFAAWMIPNGLIYFAWDTLILVQAVRWFHGPIRYAELLPVRAVTYVVSFLNTNLARAATAYYLTRKLQAPFLPLAGTVIFLTAIEMTHLALWATAGMALSPVAVPKQLFIVAPAMLAAWAVVVAYAQAGAREASGDAPLQRARRWRPVREWPIFQTFARATAWRCLQVLALRVPLFAVSLVFHYFAVRTFVMEIPFVKLVAFLPIIFMLAALPITVAHLGTTQAAWIFFFRDVAPEAQLLAYSLASHMAFMLARASLGVLFLPRAYKELFGPMRWSDLLTAKNPA